MPLQTFKKVGKWDLNKMAPTKRGTSIDFDETDRAILGSPKAVQKIERFFSKTKHNFKFFFLRPTQYDISSFTESGEITKRRLRLYQDLFELSDDDLNEISNSDNSINVLYLGNYGDDKKMLSAWILAHRFGHTFAISGENVWVEFVTYIGDLFEFLIKLYAFDGMLNQRDVSTTDSYIAWNPDLTQDEMRLLINSLGSMKSARENSITRPYEFVYELFTQYLLTGKVTLNDPPNQLSDKLILKDKEKANIGLRNFEKNIGKFIDSILDKSVGKIFLM